MADSQPTQKYKTEESMLYLFSGLVAEHCRSLLV